MAALRIAAHGRSGAVSATGIASFGRIGKTIEIFLVPVEFSEFTLVEVIPSEIRETDIESSQLVTIIYQSETGAEIKAYMIYTVLSEGKTIVDIDPSITDIKIPDPENEV